MLLTSTALAALLQCAAGLRRSNTGVKVAGVPIINYRYRHLQSATMAGAAEHGKYDWIVKFNDGVGDEQVAEFCGDDCLAMGHPGHGGVPLATVRATEEMLEKLLERFPNVAEFVEPDSPIDIDDVASESSQGLWGHNTINLAQARFTGKGVHIYVMDTGIRVSHRDFGGRAIPTLETTSGGTKECARGDTSCAGDDHSHGTHVAGTAGGATYGVAKEAELHAMKVCCGSGSNSNAGMDWVAQFALKPAVMTMSLGSYSTPESSRVAVDAVVNSGVTVTVSAGNRGTDSCLKSYTFIASALGVGASTSGDERASFSNWGTCNAIFAPGSSIVSASHTSDTGSTTMSGTSMAAPLVAGATALLLEEDPSLSPADVKRELRGRATRDVLTGLRTGDPNLLLNVGIFDPTPAPPPTPPTPQPTPAPTPPPPPFDPSTCPATSTGPDSDGDCRCNSGLTCYEDGSRGCTYSYTANRGYTSTRWFLPSCTGCLCKA